MSNKTLIPALKAHVGDWPYYVCVMKYAQVAKEFSFAYELGSNEELSELVQRGIGERTKDITKYLLTSEHRFLGSLIVAAWGGSPQYYPVKMDQHDEMVKGLDSGFGVLTFDGSQQYFALDGQHRLKAIKDAVKKNPELGSEEISVIMVSHYNTPDGKEKTRRLFSNINKNAKATSSTENIALDEDDAYAIINRRIVNEHKFFSSDGRVDVFKKSSEEGGLSISSSVGDSNKLAIISLKQLYEVVKYMAFNTPLENVNITRRPDDEVLDKGYDLICQRIESLFAACGNLLELTESVDDIRYLRKNKDDWKNEHAFLKGIIQKTVPKIVFNAIKSDLLSWEQALERLSSMDWNLGAYPWASVVAEQGGNKRKMLTSRDNVNLLETLLKAHLCPTSKQQIIRARKEFSDLRNEKYPVTQADMELQIIG